MIPTLSEASPGSSASLKLTGVAEETPGPEPGCRLDTDPYTFFRLGFTQNSDPHPITVLSRTLDKGIV